MHYGASVHRVYIVRNLLKKLSVEVIEWPPYSPDLNPIENLWELLKARAPDTEDTLQQLIEAAKEIWQVIDERVLRILCYAMPHRLVYK